ncbi:MAG: hypothetical protein DHS20C18_00310 [Saprospiraceae bacterium]|nr:MAG: hypothetical protein DHS20C18_00310 [Saprospiraceae bacterium]
MLGIMLIAIIGFFNMIGSLSKQSTETSRAYFSFSWKIFLMRFSMVAMVGVFILVLVFRINLPSLKTLPFLGNNLSTTVITAEEHTEDEVKPTKAETKQPVEAKTEQKKRYKAGDIYMKKGVAFTLVDKAKYQLDNLDHFPTVELNGVEYYLTRRERKPRS